ncbi:MAG: DUF4358 domain-containing protein [Eubacteriales bacterium]|nr:DUF4358 domain-containing protein [Eubacteriales bacterium]
MMNNTTRFILKIFSVVVLAAFLGSLFFSNYAKNIPMEQITSVMEQHSELTSLQKRGQKDIQRYFKITELPDSEFLFYKAVSPMSVDEVMIVKARSKQQADEFLEKAEAHLESQKNIFGAYGTDQMGILGEAVVASRGNYVYYFCGPDAATLSDAFLKLI